MLSRYALLALAFALLIQASTTARAQSTAEVAKIEQVSLSLSAADEPRPALEHSFWRTQRQRKPGNGAPYYYRAILLRRQVVESQRHKYPAGVAQDWLEAPLEEFPLQEVAGYLELHRDVFQQLHTAATRQQCEWDLQLAELEGLEVVSFMLHDFQELRELARLVACKARYEVAQRKYTDAIETLTTGYQMARDAAEPPLLINALIGLAISQYMHTVVLDLADAPQSPNVYWALAQLPRPLVNLQPALEFELAMPFQMFPFLKDAETAERTPEQWQKLIVQTMRDLNSLSNEPSQRLTDAQLQLAATAMMMAAYPEAKKQLIDSGMEREKVEAMPVAQVVAIQASRNYRYTYQEVFKWSLLPFPDGQHRMQQSLEKLKKDGLLHRPFDTREILPIATSLMPAVENVQLSVARMERRRAALETIEAIRMHAARTGELPAALDQLSVVPAPANPFTGRPFDYRRDERGRGILEERSPGFDPVRANDRKYLIELMQDLR